MGLTAVGSASSKSNLNISIIELSDSAGSFINGSTSNGSFTITGVDTTAPRTNVTAPPIAPGRPNETTIEPGTLLPCPGRTSQ